MLITICDGWVDVEDRGYIEDRGYVDVIYIYHKNKSSISSRSFDRLYYLLYYYYISTRHTRLVAMKGQKCPNWGEIFLLGPGGGGDYYF